MISRRKEIEKKENDINDSSEVRQVHAMHGEKEETEMNLIMQ
jgi:hypothetical protein